jgi:hypothetical protein
MRHQWHVNFPDNLNNIRMFNHSVVYPTEAEARAESERLSKKHGLPFPVTSGEEQKEELRCICLDKDAGGRYIIKSHGECPVHRRKPCPSPMQGHSGFDALRSLIIGWREFDWPAGFDRHTAQLIANEVEARFAGEEHHSEQEKEDDAKRTGPLLEPKTEEPLLGDGVNFIPPDSAGEHGLGRSADMDVRAAERVAPAATVAPQPGGEEYCTWCYGVGNTTCTCPPKPSPQMQEGDAVYRAKRAAYEDAARIAESYGIGEGIAYKNLPRACEDIAAAIRRVATGEA